MSSINAMTPFHTHFDIEISGSGTGLVFSIYAIGGLIGALFGGLASDTFGRRFGMFIGSAFIVIGVIIEITAKAVGQYIGGRFLIGFGVSISTIAGPVYLVEISPPHWRGSFGGLSHVVGFYLGALGEYDCPENSGRLSTNVFSLHLGRLWNWLHSVRLVMENPNSNSAHSIGNSDGISLFYARESKMALFERPI